MTRLTDTQLVILSAAARCESHAVLPLPRSLKVNKGAITKVLRSQGSETEKEIGRQVIHYFEYLFVFQNIFPTSSSSGFSEIDTEDQTFDEIILSSFHSLLEHRLVAGNPLVYATHVVELLSPEGTVLEKIPGHNRPGEKKRKLLVYVLKQIAADFEVVTMKELAQSQFQHARTKAIR